MKNVLTFGLLVGLMTLGMVGSAFAENANDNSILGTDNFSFNAAVANADSIAQNNYDQVRLEQAATEAGSWKFNFDAPETKADLAAKNYHYNSQKLHMVGTEYGYDEYIHKNNLNCPLC